MDYEDIGSVLRHPVLRRAHGDKDADAAPRHGQLAPHYVQGHLHEEKLVLSLLFAMVFGVAAQSQVRDHEDLLELLDADMTHLHVLERGARGPDAGSHNGPDSRSDARPYIRPDT